MRLVDKYLAKTVLQSIGVVLLLLIGLQIFIMFVDQAGAIGQGEFSLWQSVIYILLAAPYQVYLFFPVAIMLGCLLGLGILASHSELIILRANGLSISGIIWIVLKALLLLILIVTLLGELVFPRMNGLAESRKALLTSSGKALRTEQGVWVRNRNSFIHIEKVHSKTELEDIVEYAFDDHYELKTVRQAKSAHYHQRTWTLNNISDTYFNVNTVENAHYSEMMWSVQLRPTLIDATKVAPTEMTLPELHHYIHDQSRNHLQSSNFELVFWQRILQPLSSCIMMILAIPFIFGPLRSSTLGSKFLAGVTVGFGFHILNKFFGPISLVYQLPPMLAAVAPPLCFLIIALWMLRRVR